MRRPFLFLSLLSLTALALVTCATDSYSGLLFDDAEISAMASIGRLDEAAAGYARSVLAQQSGTPVETLLNYGQAVSFDPSQIKSLARLGLVFAQISGSSVSERILSDGKAQRSWLAAFKERIPFDITFDPNRMPIGKTDYVNERADLAIRIELEPSSAGFVRIPAGTFLMGSPSAEAERNSNETQHTVTISKPFYMSKYEVTQKEWVAVMGSNPSDFKGDHLPVECVSWYDAIDYCIRRSQREGLTPAYTKNGSSVTWDKNANGYRLPTEAEWEYACRAGTTTAYNSGNNAESLAGKANVADLTTKETYPNWTVVNIRDGYAQTAPVGRFAPNSWGLYDMHGNVWEWCWDRYGAYGDAAQTDPMGSASVFNRVRRGGGWDSLATGLRSAVRGIYAPTGRGSYLGFRLVCP